MDRDFRNIEFRYVIKTDMTDQQLDEFTMEILNELQDVHLVEQEEVLTALHTDKISYESTQQMKESGTHAD